MIQQRTKHGVYRGRKGTLAPEDVSGLVNAAKGLGLRVEMKR